MLMSSTYFQAVLGATVIVIYGSVLGGWGCVWGGVLNF